MYLGLGVAAAVTLGFGVWLLARRRRLAVGEVIMVAAAATLLIPLLLPQMHERYFYLAEVLTVIAIFVDRRFVLAAICIQAASISTYLAYLENARNVPLGLAAIVALGAGVGCGRGCGAPPAYACRFGQSGSPGSTTTNCGFAQLGSRRILRG
jgi:hypothetical protein